MSWKYVPAVLLVLVLMTGGVYASELTINTGIESVLITTGPMNPEFIRYLEEVNAVDVADTPMEHSLGAVPAPVWRPEVVELQGSDLSLLGYESTVDLRDQGRVSAVRDQNGWGTCWAFSSCGSLESSLLPLVNRTLSPKNMVNRHGFDNGYNDGGNAYMAAAYLTRWDGPVDEEIDPYPIENWSESEAFPPVQHVQNVFFPPARTNRTDTLGLKEGLQRWGPAYVSFFWNDSYFNPASSSYYQPETAPNLYPGGGHAVNLVGWNDTFPASAFAHPAPGDGAWIVKNSWGSAWGDQGFFYVSYYDKYFGSALVDNQYRDTAFFTGEPAGNYDRVYLHDPLGECDDVSILWSKGGTIANRFTATSPETISAIGFFTTDQNTRYEAVVCRNANNGPAGEVVAEVSGTLPEMGYHTVVLPAESRVSVRKGESFSVILTLENERNPRFAAVERRVEGYSSHATSQPGESYFSIDNGRSFIDLAGQLPDANFCIRAYTHTGTDPLTASFTASPLTGTAPLAVQFTDTTSGSPNRWFWSFGDGTQSIQQNPVKTFTRPGSYSAILTVKRGELTDRVAKRNYITVQQAERPEEA